MSAPVVSRTGADLYDALGALAAGDEDREWPLLLFCGNFGQAFFEQIATYVQDTDDGPGWSIVFDIDRCPAEALPYLAQYLGVELNSSLSEDEQRQAIRLHQNFNRGTPAAMKAAVAATLTGSREVLITEREDGFAYRMRVRTLIDDTPDPTVTEAAARSQKPGGIILAYEAVNGESWGDVDAAWGSWGDLADSGETWRDVRTTLP